MKATERLFKRDQKHRRIEKMLADSPRSNRPKTPEEKFMANRVTYGIYASGSYGIASKDSSSPVTLWFCGAWLTRQDPGQPWRTGPYPGYHGNTSRPCVHGTRQDARNCRGKEARNG